MENLLVEVGGIFPLADLRLRAARCIRGLLALLPDHHLFRTLARANDSGKEPMLALAVVPACVINGDSMTGVLRQSTWLVVAVIVLIAVQMKRRTFHGRVSSPSLMSDTSR
ncbi:hypothetical protein [Streptomyces sp. NPDC126514]|uniref:hypothetical protein n=1 Tax=Streptomyces sp. NPDC126514 TaxID=3155210 RepID=UPI00331EC113